MVDSTIVYEITPLKPTRGEQMRVYSNRYYANKIRENPEFYEKEKIRIREYNKNRYKEDPEFAEKIKARRRDYYKRMKERQLSA
jgi:hypothetical protein